MSNVVRNTAFAVVTAASLGFAASIPAQAEQASKVGVSDAPVSASSAAGWPKAEYPMGRRGR